MNKLNCILLIDDSEANNFYNKLIIEELDVTNKIEIARNGLEGLTYLKNLSKNEQPPELILLDINMPKMDGWEFLDEYEQLDDELKGKVVIVMLTTSLSPYDLEKAATKKSISEFRNKPLSKEAVVDMLGKYFANGQ